jgi:uncharacterized protein YndB with AHSA1/START domain
MLSTIAIVVVIALVVLLGFAATKPNTFQIKRAAVMQASPEKVFALINDFHDWALWSPWEKLDPTMQRTYSGAANGQGTVYAWEGKGKVGAGRMEILEAIAYSSITIKLDFIKPFEGHNTAVFTLEKQADSTKVTWTMSGPQPYMGKLMTVFCNMDSLIGKDFEAGLANIKALIEK